MVSEKVDKGMSPVARGWQKVVLYWPTSRVLLGIAALLMQEDYVSI